ncbi:SGNH/GDSL hydrolase family protein [Ruegeria sp. 2012CJ41-6]|uniref:SGNH/GDSL hydrolase family protein n=1 Tax=Ruegeria spongiae TaxID=2942209 RepID=A0ABT0PXV2_9RHOB|nr:SGNH/GDSL hydrolase family protein [Ruegeria spongiae]MCL6282445.1 SGNH/GDSL hydrolase family protein [Ruegeria spongiae]
MVRRKAQLLPEPQGPRAGRAGSGPLLRVLIAGDSSAAGVGVATQDQALSGRIVAGLAHDFTVDWRLEATTGHTTRDALDRLLRLEDRFDVAVTALGVNDVTRGRSCGKFTAQQHALLAHLTGPLQARCVVVSGVPQMERLPALPQPLAWVLGQQAARLDAGLQRVAEGFPQAHHLSTELPDEPGMAAPDGYHPSSRLYDLWANQIVQIIRDQARARN